MCESGGVLVYIGYYVMVVDFSNGFVIFRYFCWCVVGIVGIIIRVMWDGGVEVCDFEFVWFEKIKFVGDVFGLMEFGNVLCDYVGD